MTKISRYVLPSEVVKYILRNWFKVFIIATVVTILFVGYFFCEDKKAVRLQNIKDEQAKNYDIDSFTQDELNAAQNAVDAYYVLQKAQNYYDNSFIQKVDPFAVQVSTISYKIVVNTEGMESEEANKALSDVTNIRNEYTYYIQRNDFGTEVAYELGIDPQYITELVTVENEGNDGFCIILRASDVVPDLLEASQNELNTLNDNLNERFAKHQIVIRDEYESVIRLDDYYNRQKNSVTEISTCTNNLNNVLTKLSIEQVAFYNAQTGDNYQYVNPETKEVEERYESIGKVGLIKKTVIGGILGIAVACSILLFAYMYSSKIEGESDYTLSLGLKYLGDAKDNKSMLSIVEKIKSVCRQGNVNSIVITSSHRESVNTEEINYIVKILIENNIETVVVDYYDENAKSLKSIFETRNVVLVESIGKSKFKNVNEIIELCSDWNVNLIGVVNCKGVQ